MSKNNKTFVAGGFGREFRGTEQYHAIFAADQINDWYAAEMLMMLLRLHIHNEKTQLRLHPGYNPGEHNNCEPALNDF